MNTKLTLTIEEAVVVRAKQYAKMQGRSLSDLIENYLKAITQAEAKTSRTTPITDALRGSIKDPGVKDYKSLLTEELEKKYGS